MGMDEREQHEWLPAQRWAACGTSVDIEALAGRICYGGLDLSSNMDLTAWVLIFPPFEEGGRYEVLCRFFLPADNMMDRVRKDKIPYDLWVRQGFITLTPGDVVNYSFIFDQIRRDMTAYHVAELAFDRWGSQKIVTDLEQLGFRFEGHNRLVQFGQGFASMSAPSKELERMVLAGELAHGNNPVLSWMVSNVAIQRDQAGNIKADRGKSRECIDGVIAMIMAVGRAMLKGGVKETPVEPLTTAREFVTAYLKTRVSFKAAETMMFYMKNRRPFLQINQNAKVCVGYDGGLLLKIDQVREESHLTAEEALTLADWIKQIF